MRFDRFGQYQFQDTHRKRLALARKQARERAAYPLFAADIAAQQQSADEAMQNRARNWSAQFERERARICHGWIVARRLLRSYAQPERAALYAYWQRCGWPGTPSYLLSMLNMFDTGRLEGAYESLGLIGPVQPGTELAGASVEKPIRTAAGRAYWPAAPTPLSSLRAHAEQVVAAEMAQRSAQLCLDAL